MRHRRGLPLLLAAALAWVACDQGTAPDHNHEPPPGGGTCGHVDGASGVVLVTHGTTLVKQMGSTFDPQYSNEIRVQVGSLVHGIHVTFLNNDGSEINIAEDCAINRLDWVLGDPTRATITQDPGLHWYVNVEGLRPGATTLHFSLAHLSHTHFTTLDIPIVILPVAE